MTAFALQVLAIGGGEVAGAAWRVLAVIGLACAGVALNVALWRLARWALAMLREEFPQRYERPAPPAQEEIDVPEWLKDGGNG